jgi:hypothetical protein
MNAALGVIAALLLFTGTWALALAAMPPVAQFPLGAIALVLAFRLGDAVEDWAE